MTSTSFSTDFRRLRFAIVAILVIFPPTALANAFQSSQSSSERLASIAATGSHRYKSQEIAKATGLQAGKSITRDDLQLVADRLARLGIFANVQYKFSSSPDGLAIDFEVADAPTVPVTFDNFPKFSDEELAAAIKNAVVLFDGTAPETGTILATMSNAVEELIATRGLHATVAHSVVTAPTGHVQQFRIEGDVLRVADVEFSDSLAKHDPAIHQSISQIIGKPFSRSAIELFEFEQVRPIYLTHAFLRVKFAPPTARFEGDPTKPLPDKVFVLAPIDPGPAFTWGGVEWTGNSVIPAAELDKFVELNPGEVADGGKMEAGWNRVTDAYGAQGYLDAKLTPTPHYDDKAARVSYVVSISEGPQYRMGQLVLTGLSLEGERRIRAAWQIPKGAVFNRGVYDDFVDRGTKEAFSGLPFHYEKIGRFLQTDPQAGTVDVMLDFQ
ncbi:MAG TPA: POTRA domain-containing protein [Candidatus Acidoferrales bacterium]|nr:POTRA domain-containing protein [Candidatus Acidoferrales bacterium]